MHHRFVEIGIVVDDHGILAAHLADHPLHMGLPGTMGVGFAEDFQADLARTGEGDQVNLGRADQMGADVAAALKQLTGAVRQSRRSEEYRAAARP